MLCGGAGGGPAEVLADPWRSTVQPESNVDHPAAALALERQL